MADKLCSARWRKSVNSGDTGCVEVALSSLVVGVRDSKDNGCGPVLAFTPTAWTSFLAGLRKNEFPKGGDHGSE